MKGSHFNLELSKALEIPGGLMHRATKEVFPALKDLAIQSIRLESGAIRQPHIHPDAQQLDYCVSGSGYVGIVDTDGVREMVQLTPGNIVFVPKGCLHWIENNDSEPLHFLLILSSDNPSTEFPKEWCGVEVNQLAKEMMDGVKN